MLLSLSRVAFVMSLTVVSYCHTNLFCKLMRVLTFLILFTIVWSAIVAFHDHTLSLCAVVLFSQCYFLVIFTSSFITGVQHFSSDHRGTHGVVLRFA